MHAVTAGGIAAIIARRPCTRVPSPLEDYAVHFVLRIQLDILQFLFHRQPWPLPGQFADGKRVRKARGKALSGASIA
jgi:hypothetical protein